MGTVIHPQRQPPTGLCGGTAEVGLQTPGDRFPDGKATADLNHVVTDAAGIPVVHGGEPPHPDILDGFDADTTGTPELVRSLRDEAAGMCPCGPRTRPVGREQVVSVHLGAIPAHASPVSHAGGEAARSA